MIQQSWTTRDGNLIYALALTAVISPSPPARKLVAARLVGAGAKAAQVLRSSANTMRCAMALLISWLLKLKAVCSLQMLFSSVSRRVLRLNYECTSLALLEHDAIAKRRVVRFCPATEHASFVAREIQLGPAASVVAQRPVPRAPFAAAALGRRARSHDDAAAPRTAARFDSVVYVFRPHQPRRRRAGLTNGAADAPTSGTTSARHP